MTGNTVCMAFKCHQIIWSPGLCHYPDGEFTELPRPLTDGNGYNRTLMGITERWCCAPPLLHGCVYQIMLWVRVGATMKQCWKTIFLFLKVKWQILNFLVSNFHIISHDKITKICWILSELLKKYVDVLEHSVYVWIHILYGLSNQVTFHPHVHRSVDKTFHFYSARNARKSAVLATAIPSVCPSVRVSHAGIVSKRRHVQDAVFIVG